MKTARHEELVQLLEQYENLTTQQLARLLEVSLETVTAAIRLLNVKKAIFTVKPLLPVARWRG